MNADNEELGTALEAEDALFQQLERGESGCAIWTSNQGLVATRSETRLPSFEASAARSARNGWPVFVRGSGGGAVPQGLGMLNVTRVRRLSSAAALTVEGEYRDFGGYLRRALSSVGVETSYGDVPGSFCDGRFNLIANERKLVGTAQRWSFRDGDRVAMAHAVIIVDMSLDSACAAVNNFYRAAQSDKRVRSDASVNLADLVRPSATASLADTIVDQFAAANHKHLTLTALR